MKSQRVSKHISAPCVENIELSRRAKPSRHLKERNKNKLKGIRKEVTNKILKRSYRAKPSQTSRRMEVTNNIF